MDPKAEYYQRGTALVCAGRYAECDPHAKVQVAVASTVDRLVLFRKAILCCEQAIGEDNQFCDAWFIKALLISGFRNTVNQVLVSNSFSTMIALFQRSGS